MTQKKKKIFRSLSLVLAVLFKTDTAGINIAITGLGGLFSTHVFNNKCPLLVFKLLRMRVLHESERNSLVWFDQLQSKCEKQILQLPYSVNPASLDHLDKKSEALKAPSEYPVRIPAFFNAVRETQQQLRDIKCYYHVSNFSLKMKRRKNLVHSASQEVEKMIKISQDRSFLMLMAPEDPDVNFSERFCGNTHPGAKLQQIFQSKKQKS